VTWSIFRQMALEGGASSFSPSSRTRKLMALRRISPREFHTIAILWNWWIRVFIELHDCAGWGSSRVAFSAEIASSHVGFPPLLAGLFRLAESKKPVPENSKREQFAQLIVKGVSTTKAYVSADFPPRGARQSAARMLLNAVVCSRIRELQEAISAALA
jgi:hypothetical protein